MFPHVFLLLTGYLIISLFSHLFLFCGSCDFLYQYWPLNALISQATVMGLFIFSTAFWPPVSNITTESSQSQLCRWFSPASSSRERCFLCQYSGPTHTRTERVMSQLWGGSGGDSVQTESPLRTPLSVSQCVCAESRFTLRPHPF